jgi:hypothetical protein
MLPTLGFIGSARQKSVASQVGVSGVYLGPRYWQYSTSHAGRPALWFH